MSVELKKICEELNIRYDLREPLTAKEIIEQFWKTDFTEEEHQEMLKRLWVELNKETSA